MSEIDLTGISVKKTNNGFTISLTGELYKRIGIKINNGEITKQFYHELKKFIKDVINLSN